MPFHEKHPHHPRLHPPAPRGQAQHTPYNLKKDIAESNDLSQTHPEVLEKMRRQLEADYARFGAASTLPPNPEFKPNSR